MKQRLDKLLVARGLTNSREKAQALIMAGKVRSAGQPLSKAGQLLPVDAGLEVDQPEHPYVSRGGVKLAAALSAFKLNPAGWTALDIGASTGGFTHCLLLHGATKVYAVDVGYGQLAWSLRQDPRVAVLERTNIRTLATGALGELADLVVVDVSFIGLVKVLEHALRFLKPSGRVLALMKPQFEAGRENVRKGGLVTDLEAHEAALGEVRRRAAGQGLRFVGQITSPIVGKKSGNVEYLLLWDRGDSGQPAAPAPAAP